MASGRYVKLVLTIIAVCLVWICLRDLSLIGEARAQPDVVVERHEAFEAREFRLVDRKGRVRGRLAMNDKELPELILADPNGKFRLVLAIKEDGHPRIQLRDRDGLKSRAALSMLSDGRPFLSFYDSQGRTRVALGLGAGEAPGFVFTHTDKHARAGISITPDGTARLTFGDDDGGTRLGLGVYPDGSTRLEMYPPRNETPAASITVGSDGSPAMSLNDLAGKPRWQVP
ncbi:MAG: hypothetical protein V3T70_03915 [Phycisphaerae bacterium]